MTGWEIAGEVVRYLASAFAVLSAMFVVWDRGARQWPLAVIVALPKSGVGKRQPFLRVINRSERAMLISIPSGMGDNRFSFAVDDSPGLRSGR